MLKKTSVALWWWVVVSYKPLQMAFDLGAVHTKTSLGV